MGIDVREYWNFDDPAGSERVFRDLLASGTLNRAEELEVITQIARTFSLRNDCEKCNQILETVAGECSSESSRPRDCFFLELGRSFRTSGHLELATPLFRMVAECDIEDLVVDALHMLAIDADAEESHYIHLQALDVAKFSDNPWAWRWQGTLYNNMGWAYFGSERFDDALECFENALKARKEFGPVGSIRIAQWCVGRCHRALGNLGMAFTIQSSLAGPDASGYVEEELGEILLAQGHPEDAKTHFRKAVEMLESELGSDSERIIRMKSLS